MKRLIARGLRGGTSRYAISVSGIGITTMLVLTLFAADRSVERCVTSFLDRRGLDLWIAPRGSDNLVRSSGLLDAARLDEIRTWAGVKRVDPLLRSFVTAEANGKRLTLLGIGYRAPDGLGAPELFRGRAPQGRNELVIDRAAAHILGVDSGDALAVNGRSMRVAGLSRDTNLLATQFLFADLRSLNAEGLPVASFAIVEVAPNARATEVVRHIRGRFPDLAVFDRPTFTQNNLREVASGFRPVLDLITALGVISAALLVAFLVEGIVEERRGELAVLLATGARPLTIGMGLALHTIRLLATGITLGATAASLLAWALDHIAPVVPLTSSARDFAIVAALLTGSGIAACCVPLIQLKDIDPLEAFRS